MKTFRKVHRYFGLIIGIQFLFWTLGGIFFAWSNLDQIHGDFNRKPEPALQNMDSWVSPGIVYAEISKLNPVDSVLSFKNIQILDKAVYQIKYRTGDKIAISLVEAGSGKLRPPLSKQEAIALADNQFTPKSGIRKAELVDAKNVSKHHEYRNQPLPAYAVSFDHKSGTKVYVSTEYGQVLKFRNSNWRIFDFMWMMHTMDYSSRDNFGNILLRVFSVLGLVTILSGFILYFNSSIRFRKN